MNAPQTFPTHLPALIDALPADDTRAAQTEFTRARQVAFLSALAECGSARAAARGAGVSHQTVYRMRRACAVFRRAWDAALLAARVHAEDVLASRALDGVEEEVWYHGEVVATRRRYDSRLLLAHLARLDKLTENAPANAFAEDFEAALERFAEGSDTPEIDPAAAAQAKATEKTSGQCNTRSMSRAGSGPEPCPDCGGRCLGDEEDLTEEDCQWFGNRVERMDAARPAGAREPDQFPGGDRDGEIEDAQLLAFEEGVERWWLVASAPDDEDGEWRWFEGEAGS
jgi:hypothetical protein